MRLTAQVKRSPALVLALAALALACVAVAISLSGNATATPVAYSKIGAVKERSKQATAFAGDFENVEVRCKRHYESISGGVSMDPSSSDGASVYESTKNEERGWSVGVRNDGAQNVTYTAIVFCAKR